MSQWVDISQTWTHKVSSAFSEKYKEADITFSNRSINGNTSRQALERMQFDCLSHEPDSVVLQFGLNDCHVWETGKGHPRVSEASFKENILEMIDRCRYYQVKNIILNSNHPTTRTHTKLPYSEETFEDRNTIYNDILRSISMKEGNIFFFDINQIFKKEIKKEELKNYLLKDEIHLSKLGHEFYYKHFLTFICPILLKKNN